MYFLVFIIPTFEFMLTYSYFINSWAVSFSPFSPLRLFPHFHINLTLNCALYFQIYLFFWDYYVFATFPLLLTPLWSLKCLPFWNIHPDIGSIFNKFVYCILLLFSNWFVLIPQYSWFIGFLNIIKLIWSETIQERWF